MEGDKKKKEKKEETFTIHILPCFGIRVIMANSNVTCEFNLSKKIVKCNLWPLILPKNHWGLKRESLTLKN